MEMQYDMMKYMIWGLRCGDAHDDQLSYTHAMASYARFLRVALENGLERLLVAQGKWTNAILLLDSG